MPGVRKSESRLGPMVQGEVDRLLVIGLLVYSRGGALSHLKRGMSSKKKQTTAGLAWLSSGVTRGEHVMPHPHIR